jgi:CHAT domain-containing protein/tetratricopeptide (TPR) repeat protein
VSPRPVVPREVREATRLNLEARKLLWQGNFAEATELVTKAGRLLERAGLTRHSAFGMSCVILAQVATQLQDLVAAEKLARAAVAVFANLKPLEPELLADGLYTLATILFHRADFDGAREYLKSAVNELIKIGPEHHGLAGCYSTLGEIYRSQGELGLAEVQYRKALAIYRRHPTPGLPCRVAIVRNNLALVLLEQGKLPEAEKQFEQSLAALVRCFPENHPTLAGIENNMGVLYRRRGDHGRAERRYRNSLAAREAAFGPEHPSVAESRFNLASLLAATQRLDAAWDESRRALLITYTYGDRLLMALSERAREAYLSNELGLYDATISLALPIHARRREVPAQALELTLRRRGRLLHGLRLQREAAALSQDGRLPGLLKARDEAVRALGGLVSAGRGSLPVGEYAERVARAEMAREHAEEELSSASAGLLERERPVTVAAVARALGKTAALVEIVHLEPVVFQAQGNLAPSRGPARYLAFVLQGASGAGSLVDLGLAEQVDRLVQQYREAVSQSAAVAGQQGVESAQPLVTRAAEALRIAIAQRLRPALGPVQEIWLSPDGALASVPPDLLVPRGRVAVIDSGRDLLRLARPVSATTGERSPMAAGFVNPDYGAPLPGQTRVSFRALNWDAGSTTRLRKVLASAVQRHVPRGQTPQVIVLEGQEATEARLRKVHRPTLLYLFTHGVFLPEPAVGPGRPRAPHQSALTEIELRAWSDPLRRSAVALAGANRPVAAAGRTGAAGEISAADDGLLTAEEAGSLDLLGTSLVVLGACETGLGEQKLGQGLFGLRRAILYAGARSVLVSLWPVPEAETRRLLFFFLEALAAGRTKRDALLHAQRAVQKTHPLPFYHAGFVLIGDPGKL